jgi:hypothetical protein
VTGIWLRAGLCLALAALSACGIKGDPEPTPDPALFEARP